MKLSYKLLGTLRRGARCLSAEARQHVCLFMESQRQGNDTFINRGGKTDFYYTMFGWMLCYALSIPTDPEHRKACLQSACVSQDDILYQTVLHLCRLLDRLLSLPCIMLSSVALLMADDAPLRQFFVSYQHRGRGQGTNACAVQLALASKPAPEVVSRLLALQHESGGFVAHEGAGMPDMLSTAVALFALRLHHISPSYDAVPFVEAHWQEDGSFAATLLDVHGDVEYEFYGLLALGSLR